MIQLYHVSKRFENGTEALSDITLRVREGEFVFLTGASGAGKSTLLRLLLVMERVSDGQVLIGGRNVHVLRDASVPYLRRNVGLVFQDFKLIKRRTVFENVAIAMEILGLPRPEIERRVMQLLADLGLEHRARSMPTALSGGEQQRVALARALANEPAILLADEPTGNLDPALGVEIMDLLLDINRRGTTVVVATHDYALVRRYGLRVVHLEGGRLADDRARTHPAADVGDPLDNHVTPIAGLADADEAAIAPARRTGPRVALPNQTVIAGEAVVPGQLEPSSVQPSSVQPSSVQPSSVQPSSVQPSSVEPSSVEPSDTSTAKRLPSTTAVGLDGPTDADIAPISLPPAPASPRETPESPGFESPQSRRGQLSGGFTATNVRIGGARITGPIMPIRTALPADRVDPSDAYSDTDDRGHTP